MAWDEGVYEEQSLNKESEVRSPELYGKPGAWEQQLTAFTTTWGQALLLVEELRRGDMDENV